MIKLVLYGHSGVGKSTTTKILKEKLNESGKRVKVIKLAEPLYELQRDVYNHLHFTIPFYQQDQILLESLATNIRRISPTYLVDRFLKHMMASEVDVVINDDLRDPYVDYPKLMEQGFQFIRVHCNEDLRLERLNLRNDLTRESRSTENLDLIKSHFEVDNSYRAIDGLKGSIDQILEVLYDTHRA